MLVVVGCERDRLNICSRRRQWRARLTLGILEVFSGIVIFGGAGYVREGRDSLNGVLNAETLSMMGGGDGASSGPRR